MAKYDSKNFSSTDKNIHYINPDDVEVTYIFPHYPTWLNPVEQKQYSVPNIICGLFPILGLFAWYKVFCLNQISIAINPVVKIKTKTHKRVDKRYRGGYKITGQSEKRNIIPFPEEPYRHLNPTEEAYRTQVAKPALVKISWTYLPSILIGYYLGWSWFVLSILTPGISYCAALIKKKEVKRFLDETNDDNSPDIEDEFV